MSESKKKTIGIVGCGKIFKNHLLAIENNNNDYSLVAVCDSNPQILNSLELGPEILRFSDFDELLSKMQGKMDMVVIATPNSLHQPQAIIALQSGYDVLIEKPVAFTKADVDEITKVAIKTGHQVHGVLQVRYNPSVVLLKKIVDSGILGKIRSISLIQRWQRPDSYFADWRGDINVGGRTLYEVGIHYLDIVSSIFGKPKVLFTKSFKLKHKSVSFEDSVYSIVEFPSATAGTIEISIAAEPHNLECSLTVIAENGMIKLGGKALNTVEAVEVIDTTPASDRLIEEAATINEQSFNDYGNYKGSSPNHPQLYRLLAMGQGITLPDISNTISFIEDIYAAETLPISQ